VTGTPGDRAQAPQNGKIRTIHPEAAVASYTTKARCPASAVQLSVTLSTRTEPLRLCQNLPWNEATNTQLPFASFRSALFPRNDTWKEFRSAISTRRTAIWEERAAVDINLN